MPDHSSYNTTRAYRDRLHELSVEAHSDNTHREYLTALLETLRYELNASYHKELSLVVEMELLTRAICSTFRSGKANEPFDGQYVLNVIHKAKEGMLARYAAEQAKLLESA